MSFTYTGLPGIHAVTSGTRYSPATGRVRVERYQGQPLDILGFQNLLERTGVPYNIPGSDDGFLVIEVEIPQSASPATELNVTWDLVGNDTEKDIYTHGSLAGVNASSLSALRQWSADYDAGTRSYSELISMLTGEEVVYGMAAGLLTNLFILHASSVNSYSDSAWVLRRTAKLGPNFPAQQDVPNLRKVWETTADLVAGEGVPATRKFKLPDGQWLKRTPNYQQQSNGITVYTQEWWWALEWSVTLYERAA